MPVKRRKSEDFAPSEIAYFARLLRKLLRIEDQKAPNLLVIFEELKKIFPKLGLRIVEYTEPGAEARAYPASWIIKISRGVHEGLRRGDAGARWTFAHELGHVLLQHPGKPFRMRSASGDNLVEQQAHIFAAHFLAPSHLAKKYKSPEEIALTFHVSIEAARRRFSEIEFEEQIKKIGTRRSSRLGESETANFERIAAIVYSAISTTIAENRTACGEPFKDNLFSATLLVAAGAALISDAFESLRPKRKSAFVQAACLATALFTIGPIREIGSGSSKEIAKLNQFSALKSVEMLLQLEAGSLNQMIEKEGFQPGEMLFHSTYLDSLIRVGENLIADSATILHVRQLPSYYDYNGNGDTTWREIHDIENLSNIFALWASSS